MKKPISDIILNSLQYALVIDDDSSISYYKNQITNTHEQIMDLDELYEIFNEHPIDLFKKKYNTKKAVSLILDDDSEISLYEYRSDMNAVFLKITDNILSQTDNDILIYLKESHCEGGFYRWLTDDIEQYIIDKKEINDISGFDNCLKIKEFINKHNLQIELPAIDYCMKINKYGYQGYLPAIGQLLIVVKYLDMINYILKHLKSNKISFVNDHYLSSSESTWFCVYDIRSNDYNAFVNKFVAYQMINKISFGSCLPFFHKVN